MTGSITIRQCRDVDAANAFLVTITTDLDTRQHNVHTNPRGEGLWVDGVQVLGTCQFRAGKNPREAIRRYFQRTIR